MQESKQMRKLDGVFFRVERDGKWMNVCLSDMTTIERHRCLKNWNDAQLLRCVDILADTLRDIGDHFDIERAEVEEE